MTHIFYRHLYLYRDTIQVPSEDGINESYIVGPRKAKLFGIRIPMFVADWMIERLTR